MKSNEKSIVLSNAFVYLYLHVWKSYFQGVEPIGLTFIVAVKCGFLWNILKGLKYNKVETPDIKLAHTYLICVSPHTTYMFVGWLAVPHKTVIWYKHL